MNFIKKHKYKILFALISVAVLSISFFCSGENVYVDKTSPVADLPQSNNISDNVIPATPAPSPSPVPTQTPHTNPDDTPCITSVPSPTEEPVNLRVCDLTVRCDTAVRYLSGTDSSKLLVIPQDGIILQKNNVSFSEGESVFDILIRQLRENQIHFEHTSTPVLNSSYIEGISNLYEFDCGPLSGWMYSINDVFPSVGISQTYPNPGDKISVIYTCDFGKDIGASNNQQE